VACTAIGVAAAALVVGHRPGLGVALLGILVWLPAVRPLLRRRAVGDLVTAALSVALVAVVALRDAGWLAALCMVVGLGLAAVASTSARSAPAVLLSGPSWSAGAVRALPWVGRRVRTIAGSRRHQLAGAARSLVITVVLLVVFGALFASADRVFASYVPRVDLDLLPGHVVVGGLAALTAATLAHLATSPPGWSTLTVPPGRRARRSEWLLPVGSLAALVLAFVAVQVGALVGGHRYVLETAGLSYAEYARQGFGQLVVVTTLTLVVVGVAARVAPVAEARDRLVVRLALGLLCLGSLGVVASALRRMALYLDAFGLTRLRIVVVVLELTLGVVFLLVVVAGARWPSRGAGWLPRTVVQVLAIAVIGLAASNPDALIVRHNAAAHLVVPLDVDYLRGLSADAVPAAAALDEPLRSCVLAGLEVPPDDTLWSWNLGRSRASEVADDDLVTAAVADACRHRP
jgi:hypothetical protein